MKYIDESDRDYVPQYEYSYDDKTGTLVIKIDGQTLELMNNLVPRLHRFLDKVAPKHPHPNSLVLPIKV